MSTIPISKTASQDGGISRLALSPYIPKEALQLTSKQKHPELTENQTVLKSNNQGFKEDIFIQMGRRDRERELAQRGSGVVVGGGAVVTRWQWLQ